MNLCQAPQMNALVSGAILIGILGLGTSKLIDYLYTKMVL